MKEIIEKSVKNGYNISKFCYDNLAEYKGCGYDETNEIIHILFMDGDIPVEVSCTIEEIIFDREFAKAFFGEDYKHNLQQLVIADDRVKYLRDFLKNNE